MGTQAALRILSNKSVRLAVLSEGSLLLGLIGLALLSRLIFTSRTLYHFDSVNFALALGHFDVRIDQPQVPGYMLYVALGQLVNGLLRDPNTTLVWLSVIGSALAVAAMWALGRAMFDRRAGWIAALLLLTSPLFWFYGEIALPHSLDLLGVTVTVWLLYQVRCGQSNRLPWAALALGLAGGLRPQTLVFLLPLAIFAASRAPWKSLSVSIIVLGVTCLTWLAPLLAFTGGLGDYLKLFSSFSAAYQDATSIFGSGGLWGLSRNTIKLVQYSAYAWGAGLLPIVLWPFLRAKADRQEPVSPTWRARLFGPQHERAWFIAIWVAPALTFYTLIHMGQQGLVFVFLPALLLLSAEACVQISWWFASHLSAPAWGSARSRLGAFVGAMALSNALVFVFAPEFPLGNDSIKLLTHATIERQDREMQSRITMIRSTFPADRAVIIAAQWRHTDYYLAEYAVLRFELVNRWEREGGLPLERPDSPTIYRLSDLALNPQGATVVLFDPELANFNNSLAPARPISVDGTDLPGLNWSPDQVLWMSREGFQLGPAPRSQSGLNGTHVSRQ